MNHRVAKLGAFSCIIRRAALVSRDIMTYGRAFSLSPVIMKLAAVVTRTDAGERGFVPPELTIDFNLKASIVLTEKVLATLRRAKS